MMHAQMIVAVIAARLTPRPASGGALSPLTARAVAVIAARRRASSSAAVGRGAARRAFAQQGQQRQ